MKRVFFVALAFIVSGLLIAMSALPVSAQDFRGEVTGRVTDASGARLPGVTITATNVATNVATPTTTNGEGDYAIPFLTPGTYTVTAELSGFKKIVREHVEVRVADKIGLDLSMEVGKMEETVTVTAQTPLLDTMSGSTGAVVDQKIISMMPLSDGNPFTLARLSPGIAYTGDLKFSRPFDNGGTTDFTTAGAPHSSNEFTLDGSPNMASGQRVAFVPPADAVQQFKVQTSSFDASSGHTGGSTVNVALKSGTNRYSGSAYEYYRSDKLAENDFFLQRAGQPKAQLGYKRSGGSVGGPLLIPGLYDGHNRTFFFGGFEWLYDRFPEPITDTVPTDAMRNGDFSALLSQGIIIYDPLSAQKVGNSVVRQPFDRNIIPSTRINAIAQKVLSYYPEPNQTANPTLQDNFVYANPRNDRFNSQSIRLDHEISQKNRIFGRYTRNSRREARNAQLGTVNDVIPQGNYLYRKNDGITVDDTYTQNSNSLWDIRVGWQRFREPNVRQHQGIFDPATLGFSPSVLSLFDGARYFPHFGFDTIHDIGDNLAGNTVHSIYSFQPTYTRLVGDHSIRAGYDVRLYHEFSSNLNRQAGEYTTSRSGAFTRQTDTAPTQNYQDVASFLLGFPTGGAIDLNGTRLNDTWYQALFVQDDWKVSSKLTLNLGLRYDYESPTTDAENRNVRGFDPNATLSITSAAEAAYAAKPDVIPASQWRARGGVQFASSDHPGFWNADKNNVQPRVGFAYRLNDKTVLRGGTGVYTIPLVIAGTNQMGYSQSTPFTATQDKGLTFQSTLDNPYPLGVLQPAGNSLGPNTFLGQSLSRFFPLNMRNSQLARYQVTVQRELPGQWILEGGYVGSHGYDLTTSIELNPIPAQYLSTSRVRDQATIDYLATLVSNPFVGLLPTGFTNSTVARSQLLRPYPQFSNVPSNASDGTSQYDSGQVQIEKRFSKGYSALVTYTRSHYTERVSKLNDTDTSYEKRLSRDDVPNRVTTYVLYELPFGRGRHWASGASGLTNSLIGGWSVNVTGQFQSGRPLDFGGRNIYFNGDLKSLKAHYTNSVDRPVWDISGFYFHDDLVPLDSHGVPNPRGDNRIRLSNNIRYFPSRVDGLRSPFLKLWDMSIVKQVPLSGRVHAQFEADILNTFNTVVYNDANTDPTNANFGKVTSQNNLPREVQLAAKIVF